ncbi:MAG: preprotein translocase subunit YajC [Myxococcales bacterium]|nr:preprotein translocase subunit YajC [Myxococcales bacterium]
MPFVLMFVIFYFLLIRPQQKRAREQREMLARLKKGDVVVTSGGIIGTIHALTDAEIVLEVADRMKVRVLRAQVNLYAAAADGATPVPAEKGK